MKKERLESLFEELQGFFDTEEPGRGHRERFLLKLEAQKPGVIPITSRSRQWWRPIAAAASVVLIALVGIRLLSPAPSIDEQVANISPEISQTEFYFASLIEEQVQKMKNESGPETRKLVEDTLLQLGKLEDNYKKLEQDLLRGGNSQMILSAMITNFQTRIDLLKEVLEKIEAIKNLKTDDNENYTI